MNAISLAPRDRDTLAALDALTTSVVGRGDLARHLGCDKSTISLWWSGERAMGVAALLAIGRRVAAGSTSAGVRFVGELGHAIGLRGRWVVDATAPAADASTIASLARATGAAADLLEDGRITLDEAADAAALVDRLERDVARIRAAIVAGGAR